MTAPENDWTLVQLLTDRIGSGPKSATDMTREQAATALRRILDREPDPTTLGAFLLANRWKRNTPEELAGFVDVMHSRSVEPAEPAVEPVDCGANYDGKSETALLGVGAGIVAAAAGTPVVVHSGDRVPASSACAYKHVLDELGVPTDLAREASATMVDDIGFGFYYQPRFNPEIHALLDRRERMGVRTFLNTIETLANPANASVHLGSFYHLPFARKIADTVAASETLSLDRVIMFQGLEGYDDIRPGYTKVAEFQDGELTDYEIETAEYGMDFETDDIAVADVPSDSAQITEEVLTGQRDDQFAEAVALNAAFRIYASGDVDELADGVALARRVIADGDAAAVLADLQAVQPEPDNSSSVP
jgi:anthranilate phosphoribosyltransferase